MSPPFPAAITSQALISALIKDANLPSCERTASASFANFDMSTTHTFQKKPRTGPGRSGAVKRRTGARRRGGDPHVTERQIDA